MARITGSIGSILPVRLAGCTRICQTTPACGIVQLNPTYRDINLGSWTDGNAVPHEHRIGRATPGDRDHGSGTCGRNSPGRKCWRPPWPVSSL